VVSLICGNFVQHSFESALGNVNFTFVFSLFLFPIVLVSRQQLMSAVGIFFLCADLLLGCFQPSLDLCICIHSFVTFPGELRQSRRGTPL
jgi:hypothetical protein